MEKRKRLQEECPGQIQSPGNPDYEAQEPKDLCTLDRRSHSVFSAFSTSLLEFEDFISQAILGNRVNAKTIPFINKTNKNKKSNNNKKTI